MSYSPSSTPSLDQIDVGVATFVPFRNEHEISVHECKIATRNRISRLNSPIVPSRFSMRYIVVIYRSI